MTGTIYKRPVKKGKPTWRLQVSGGFDDTGKRIRYSKTFPTKGEAELELQRILSDERNGAALVSDPRTVAEFFDYWLRTHVDVKLSPTTARRYRALLRPVSEAVGKQPLRRLTAMALEEIYAGCYGKVSKRTVAHIHGCVRSALATATRLKMIPFNPASACVLAAPERHEAHAVDMRSVEVFARAGADSWVGTLLRLAADTGARRGELCALRWRDVGLDLGLVTISQALIEVKGQLIVKTTKQRRNRRIPVSPSTIECLRMHREAQEEARLAFGDDYRTDLDLVFAAPDGGFLRPNSVGRACSRIAKAAGLAEVSLKTLRHSHASIALANGVPLPVVSKRLGHSNNSTTANIYSHALPNDEIAAADAWQKLKLEAASGLDKPKKEKILVAPFGTAAPTKKAVTN